MVFQKADSEEPSRDEIMLGDQLNENQKVWYPLYVHDINDYTELDEEVVLDGQDPDSSVDLKLVQLEAGPFTLNAAGLRGLFDIFSVDFKTDDQGRPATQDMIDRWKKEREKQRAKDQRSFEKQYGISSYTELPGEGGVN